MADLQRTPIKEIRARIKAAYDRKWRDSIYNQMRYAFGHKWNEKAYDAGASLYPDYPDIRPYKREVGTSRKIDTTQFIHLTKMMSREPMPSYEQLDPLFAEARSKAWLSRYREYEFGEELRSAFLEGDSFGVGFIEAGVQMDPVSGRLVSIITHRPLLSCYWDPAYRNVGRSRYWGYIDYLPLDVALDRFPDKRDIIMANQRMVDPLSTDAPDAMKVVKVWIYWDRAEPYTKPTYCAFINDPDGEVLAYKDNPYIKLPMSYYTHVVKPGIAKPTGRVYLQMATQEAINDIERALRRVSKKVGYDLVDTARIEEGDLNTLKAMAGGEMVRVKGIVDGPPVVRITAAEASRTLMELYGVLDRGLNIEGSSTDADKGVLSEQRRTLGENILADQRSQIQTGWTEIQVISLIRRTITAWEQCARLADRAPCPIDLFGAPILLNDPSDPAKDFAEIFATPTYITVDEASLREQDTREVKYQRVQEITMVFNSFPGMIRPDKAARECLETLGFSDIDDWLVPMMGASDPEIGTSMPMSAPIEAGVPSEPTTGPGNDPVARSRAQVAGPPATGSY